MIFKYKIFCVRNYMIYSLSYTAGFFREQLLSPQAPKRGAFIRKSIKRAFEPQAAQSPKRPQLVCARDGSHHLCNCVALGMKRETALYL